MPTNEWGQPIGETLDFKTPPHPSNVNLEGRYCKVVPITKDLAKDLYEVQLSTPDSPKNWTYLLTEPPKSFEEYKQWVDDAIVSKDPVHLAIIDKKTDKPVGTFSYLRIFPQIANIEVGHVHFSPVLSRTPLSTEAHALLMQHAFDLGYRRYEWKCDSLNGPSKKAAARLGFTYEGEFRKALIYKNRTRNTSWFSITDDEYPAIKAAFEAWLDPSNFDSDGKQRKRLEDFRSV